MKPSAVDSHQLSIPSKPLHSVPNHPNPNTTNPLFYEPTSVLDPHLTSSPAGGRGGGATIPDLPWLSSSAPHPSDDWDPVSFLFSEKDDFTSDPNPQFHYPENHSSSFPSDIFELPDLDPFPSSPPPTFDRSHLDLLLRAAHAIESNDLPTAHVILSRLNHQFPSAAAGVPLQRAAFHFKDALLSLLPIPNPPIPSPPLSPLELIRHISAHKFLSDLSPIPQFTTLTANQSLLESLLPSSPSSPIHLIDFDLGLGGQWSSFAQEIAAQSRSSRSPPPPIRITAVVPEESVETALAADNLRDFAQSLGLHLSVDFVRVAALGTLALSSVRLSAADSTAVVLSPSIFRLLGSSPETSAALLRFICRASPKIVVFVDTECESGSNSPPSFKRSFARGLEFYSAVLESLDSAAAATGSGEESVRRIERCVIRPRVFASVVEWGPRAMTWREVFAGAGMSPVPFSEVTESQAEWLLRRAPVEGFQVARSVGAMVLSWRGRELAATSAWRC